MALDPLRFQSYGRMVGILHGGVYLGPQAGQYAHIQIFNPQPIVEPALPTDFSPSGNAMGQYIAWLFEPIIVVDVYVTVRIGFIDTALATLVQQGAVADRQESSNLNLVEVHTQYDPTELAMAANTATDIPLAPGAHRIPGVWRISPQTGLVVNPRTQGVGIGLWSQWAEGFNLDLYPGTPFSIPPGINK